MTLQEELVIWRKNSTANDETDIIVDDLNDGIINPIVGVTVKTPALQVIVHIENDRSVYQAEWIAKIEAAIVSMDE